MFAAFAFAFKTYNVVNQLYCETKGAGVYHLNRLNECFNGDLTEIELEIERQHVHLFERLNGNPVLDTITYVVNNYKGKPKIVTNKYVKKRVSSYKYQIVGHNASVYDNYIVLNSLPESYTGVKT